jgi:hypothetical protein
MNIKYLTHLKQRVKDWALKNPDYNSRITKALFFDAHCGGMSCQDCICVDSDLCTIFKHASGHKTEIQHRAAQGFLHK